MYRQLVFSILLCGLMCVPMSAAKRKVHTIGDSTMSAYKPAATPKRGWGMYLQAFFNPDSVEVNNRGKSGASTRTFYETENLWPSVRQQMSAGDYLIIQFAHNDEKCKGYDVYQYNDSLRALGKDTTTDMRGTDPNTTYKEYLRRYVQEARDLGVTPILMSPICRAYFQKDGLINQEGRHVLSADKDYVRSMREVAEEMHVPFLDMTARTRDFFEEAGQEFCMTHYFNCGDKTHTSADGGMIVALQAYTLIMLSDLDELKSWTVFPTIEAYRDYAQRIEEAGRQAAIEAAGMSFTLHLDPARCVNMLNTHKGFLPTDTEWPAGEIDEVQNRYIEYELTAPKKKGLLIEAIVLEVQAKGGDGMNIHINSGFGDYFRDVTTLYENTALPKNRKVRVALTEPILVPAGETLRLRILPWYDSKITPQRGKYLLVSPIEIRGKELR